MLDSLALAFRGSLRTRALRMMKLMKPGGLLGNLTFPYVNTWWEKKDEDNVLLLHYADAKKDLPGQFFKIKSIRFLCELLVHVRMFSS